MVVNEGAQRKRVPLPFWLNMSVAKHGDVYIAYQVLGDGPNNLVFASLFVSNIEVLWDRPDIARWLLLAHDECGAGPTAIEP